MEKLSEEPKIETKFGGPALADEVYNDSEEIRIVVNQLIDEQEKIKKVIRCLASGLDRIDLDNILNLLKE